MKELIDKDVIFQAVALIFSFIGILTTAMLYFEKLKALQKERREKSKSIELDLLRKSYEDKIYGLTDKLLASGARWEDINHLLMASPNYNSLLVEKSSKIHFSDFLRFSGLKENELTVQKNLVFVLTPFNPTYIKTFDAIKRACERMGLTCIRGDEEYIRGEILPNILKQVAQARLIIANIDGRNPNVFYELGIAHAMDKPVLMIASSIDNLTFDLQSKQILLFKNQDDLQQKLRDALTKLLIHE